MRRVQKGCFKFDPLSSVSKLALAAMHAGLMTSHLILIAPSLAHSCQNSYRRQRKIFSLFFFLSCVHISTAVCPCRSLGLGPDIPQKITTLPDTHSSTSSTDSDVSLTWTRREHVCRREGNVKDRQMRSGMECNTLSSVGRLTSSRVWRRSL